MVPELPDNLLTQLSRNKIFISTFLAWFLAQAIKVAVGIIRERRFNFKWFARSGGMPSSHSALSMCLTTSVGLYYGFDSGLFAMALGFAVITMFDAQGVRRHSGRQAAILNMILEDINMHRPVPEDRLKELMGHTPIEVFAGMGLGIAVATCLYFRG